MLSRLRYIVLALRKNLIFRFSIGVILPVVLVMLSMAVLHYVRELRLFERQTELNSVRVADLMAGSLRYAMLKNDHNMMAGVMLAGSKVENLERIQLINPEGEVRAAFPSRLVGTRYDINSIGCDECHRLPVAKRPQMIRYSVNENTIRIASPIMNDPDCFACHSNDDVHLGMMLVDISLAEIENHLQKDLLMELLITLATTVIALLGIYWMLQRLLLRRMRALREPLLSFAAGDFSARLPVTPGPPNELDHLAETFNEMADRLSRHTRYREERTALRERAIREERERIARELHDGFAQLLGYISTKVIATRLFLRKGKVETAKTQLAQLEDATQKMFVDVREAILGLKMSTDCCIDFLTQVREYTKEFSRLSNLPVSIEVDPSSINSILPGEVELQLLRIVQEALTNARKHAEATGVTIRLNYTDETLTLSVHDNGIGINIRQSSSTTRPKFGMDIMKERAVSIGATLSIKTRPEVDGTTVIVTVPLGAFPE